MNMHENFKWIWIPNIRVDNFYLNKKINVNIMNIYDFKLINIDNELDDEIEFLYRSDKFAMSISLSQDMTCNSMEIWGKLYLNKFNIIGSEISDLIDFIRIGDILLDSSGDFYQSDALNALFWVENNIVTSISL